MGSGAVWLDVNLAVLDAVRRDVEVAVLPELLAVYWAVSDAVRDDVDWAVTGAVWDAVLEIKHDD